MIEEIIYTSAEKGLKAGSRGFCTVVSTAGMAINTAERLESMSGYRHAFPMQDPKAALNPVNYSHVTLRIGGKNTHVISRVADAGQDYSGRTNKLAHHLMIDDVSRMTAGPARLMAEKGVLVSQWDGNVRTVPARNLPAPTIPQSIPLTAWKQMTGDSGWAGWVAEQLTKDKSPVSIIFPPGTDTLLLVREVLDLLPITQQWTVTFSTYFTKLLAGTECQLRFVLHDTPDATALRNDARAKVVDLTARLSECSGGALVQAARTGQIQAARPSDNVHTASPTASRGPTTVRSDDRQIAARSAADIPAIPKATSTDIALTNANDRRIPSLRTFETPPAPPTRSRALLYSAMGLTLGAISVVWFAIYLNRSPDSDATAGNAPPNSVARSTTRESDPIAPPSSGETQAGTQTSAAESSTQESLAEKDIPMVSAQAEVTSGEGLKPVSESAGKLIAAEPLVATSDTGKEPPSSTPQAPKPGPFHLVDRDPDAKYPNHPNLRLFKLPNALEVAENPSIRLVLDQSDRVELAFHGSFRSAINSPEGRQNDFDIQLSKKEANTLDRIWTAHLLVAGKRELDTFGEYRLTESPGESGVFTLEFQPGPLCKSPNPTNRGLSSLFQFCPLVVSVQSQRTDACRTEVFAQRRGRILKAEGTTGVRSSPFVGQNDFAYLHVFRKIKAEEESLPFSLHLEITTLLPNGTLATNSIPFQGRVAKGNLFSSVVGDDRKGAFVDVVAAVDSDAGYVQHSVDFRFGVDDLNSEAPFQFTVSKVIEARLRLPWMPRRNSEDKHPGPVAELLLKCDSELDDNLWAATVKKKLREVDFRLPVDSKRAEIIDSNWNNFNTLVAMADLRLDQQKKMIELAIDAEKLKGEKGKAEEISRLNDRKTEVESRKDLLSELLTIYGEDAHNGQAQAYLEFSKIDALRKLGYEVAIHLAETKLDGIVHPRTSVYLIEADFNGEQQ